MAERRPVLVVNPSGDRVFGTYAEMLLDHGAMTPEQLQKRLRSSYPAASVHARVLSDEPTVIWYAYRDGRWVNGDAGRTSSEREAGRLEGYQRVVAAGRGDHSRDRGAQGHP